MSIRAAYDVLDHETSLSCVRSSHPLCFASSEPFPLPTGDNMRTTNLKRMLHTPISFFLESNTGKGRNSCVYADCQYVFASHVFTTCLLLYDGNI